MDRPTRMQPAKVKFVQNKLVQGGELTDGEKQVLIGLTSEYLTAREPENAVREFYRWIQRGDSILGPILAELDELRTLTSKDGDTISRKAVLELFAKFYNNKPKNDVDVGVNWVIDKFRSELENLHKI